MKNVCSECKKDAKILYPGDICPRCYGEKVPGSNERERAWKDFMEKSPTNSVTGDREKDSGVIGK